VFICNALYLSKNNAGRLVFYECVKLWQLFH